MGDSSVIAIVLVAFLAIQPAFGLEVMRCGTELVERGDTQYEVLSKCGEPTFINEDIFGRERWIYDQGAGEFLKILTFSEGELRNIEEGERQ